MLTPITLLQLKINGVIFLSTLLQLFPLVGNCGDTNFSLILILYMNIHILLAFKLSYMSKIILLSFEDAKNIFNIILQLYFYLKDYERPRVW